MFDRVPYSYPPAFAMNTLRQLRGGVNKQRVKIQADISTSAPNNISNFRLPISALVNFNSLCLFFKASGTGTSSVHAPRYSSTFIQRLQVSFNGVSVSLINDYAHAYNIFADLHNKGKERAYDESLDPSVNYSEGDGSSGLVAISADSSVTGTNSQMSNQQFVVNNWLGFINSLFSQIVNTDLTGECQISISWASPKDCLGLLAGDSFANESYTISDLYMTAEIYAFTDNDIYRAMADKDEIHYGFNNYICTRFPKIAKTAGINVVQYISSPSVDMILGTALLDETQPSTFVNYWGGGDGSTTTQLGSQAEILADPIGKVDDAGSKSYGDAFNNVKSMIRNLSHLDKSAFYLNNKMLHYSALNSSEIHQGNLTALGDLNIDVSRNSYHEGALSIYHFLKYYAFHAETLKLNNPEGWYGSGINTSGSSLSINWVCTFQGASNTLQIVPFMVIKESRIMKVGRGRQISIE